MKINSIYTDKFTGDCEVDEICKRNMDVRLDQYGVLGRLQCFRETGRQKQL